MDKPSRHALRRADFKTGILLSLVSVMMLWTALGYPLKESYGGVENSWYVSPALLPLIVAVLLLTLSVVLLLNALIYAHAHKLKSYYLDVRQFLPAESGLKTLLVINFIAGYTWFLLGNIDFVIATSLFLISFVGVFYVAQGAGAWRVAAVYSALCLLIVALVKLIPEQPGSILLVADGFGLVGIAVVFSVLGTVAGEKPEKCRRLTLALSTSIAVAFLVAISFRFGLLVPLPGEGLVIESLHTARGLLR